MPKELTLDFKEPPRTVTVPFNVALEFFEHCQAANIRVHWWEPKRGFYRVNLSRPLPDSFRKYFPSVSSLPH